ncbi:MAG TPA: hypothetical protein VGG28_20355 [Kofleriaceae bacterium]|jgi:hypothetical protein
MRPALNIVLVCGFAGCITPSIPIPPPDPSDMTFDIAADGGSSSAVLTYPADSIYIGGMVYLQNHNTGFGVFQPVNVDGSIGPTQPLAAGSGDEVVVSIGLTDQTVSTCVVLRQGIQDPTALCTF